MPLPTQVTQHKEIPTANNHGVVSFTFASGSPAFTGMTSNDLYKTAFRSADKRLFFVSAVNSGVGTWHQIALIDDVVLLGETSTTAYRGDHGKTAYDHALVITGNPHVVTKADVGLSNVADVNLSNCDNTADSDKPISTATQTALDNIKNGKINQLSVYADNATALADGKVAGDLYRTSADPSLVAQVY